MPTNSSLLGQITEQIQGDWSTVLTSKAGQLIGAWKVLLIAAFLACVLGFAFLFIINKCALCITLVCLGLLIVAPLGFGTYFIYIGVNGGVDGLPSTGDGSYDQIVGVALLFVGVLFGLLTACCQKAIPPQ